MVCDGKNGLESVVILLRNAGTGGSLVPMLIDSRKTKGLSIWQENLTASFEFVPPSHPHTPVLGRWDELSQEKDGTVH